MKEQRGEEKKFPHLKTCPICSGNMSILELQCDECATKISGKFAYTGKADHKDSLPNISPEILNFIKVFIYAEGNIKKTEGILNCSYPKIKNLLRQAKESLGVGSSNSQITKKEQEHINENILDQLNNGQITYEEALKKLKN